MVLLHHVYRTMLINRGYLPEWLHNAVSYSFSGGVDIFFVISGFVIYISMAERPKSLCQFIVDRISRIVPAYWFYSCIFSVILIYYPWTHPSSSFEFVHFIKSLLFIPAQNPANSGMYPTLIVGWTLNFEMMFYVIFALSIIFGMRYLHVSIIVMLIFVYLSSQHFSSTEFYATDRILEFGMGVALARLYLRHKHAFMIKSSVSILLLILSFYVLLFIDGDVFVTNGIPSMFILYSAICLNGKVKHAEFLDLMGDSSYTIYLSHKIFISLGVIICKSFGYGFEVMAIPVILFSLLFSFFTYKLVELTPSRVIRRIAKT